MTSTTPSSAPASCPRSLNSRGRCSRAGTSPSLAFFLLGITRSNELQNLRLP
ncbi:hypothetical protein Hanom_Chr13g01220511 [Helianthus anomalus]